MKYTTANQAEAEAAREYLSRLITDKRTVEIKRVQKRRTLSQNSYLHLLLGAFGAHFGYTLDEAKVLYKRLNDTIYGYTKNNVMFYKSSADLTVDEMLQTIDRFREYSADNGYDLPLATDTAWIQSLENTIEQNRNYL